MLKEKLAVNVSVWRFCLQTVRNLGDHHLKVGQALKGSTSNYNTISRTFFCSIQSNVPLLIPIGPSFCECGQQAAR